MANVSAVDRSIEDELRNLEGAHATNGVPQKGVLELLQEHTYNLTNWLDLSVEERLAIPAFFGKLAVNHKNARNEHNVIIGSQADAMLDLSRNPMAMKLKAPLIRREAEDRHTDLGTIKKDATRRRVQYGQWLVRENKYLGQAYQIVLDMIDSQADDAAALDRTVREIWFNVQPFNAFAADISATGRKIEDVAVLKGLAHGIQFVRFKPYLEEVFRIITSPRAQRLGLAPDDRHDLAGSLSERMAALEEMPLQGPYRDLAGRILRRMDITLDGLRTNKDHAFLVQTSQEAKTLIDRHSLTTADPATEQWYSHTLVGTPI
jgi:hypothetical protein